MIDKQAVSPCFIDSNIWLYALIQSQDREKHKIANEITRSENIFISTQVINEVCSNLIKKTLLSNQEIQGIITGFYQACTVIEFNESILLKAADLRNQHLLSYWDSLIVAR